MVDRKLGCTLALVVTNRLECTEAALNQTLRIQCYKRENKLLLKRTLIGHKFQQQRSHCRFELVDTGPLVSIEELDQTMHHWFHKLWMVMESERILNCKQLYRFDFQ